ncbi:guanine nucleotide-binding protein subunit beta-like protein [Cladorrhinum sp. PSN332]|nr:guanine nucleotide-binding protein subunit beta-like protein [Cladorrhinum sp. PSN332]
MSNTAPPPPFRSTVEESLAVPLDDNSDRQSTTSSARRRWDDPPEELPGGPSPNHEMIENMTTMVFIKSISAKHPYNSEICHLEFSSCDTHLAALIPRSVNLRAFHPDEPGTVSMLNVKDGARVQLSTASYGLRASGGFTFRPGADLVVACPFYVKKDQGELSSVLPRVEIYDYGRKTRWTKQDVPMRAPIVFSPDGATLAGVSTRNPSRIVVAAVRRESLSVKTMVLKHTEEVTKLAFLPPDGSRLVSAGRDGYVRITSLDSGRTLNRIEIGGRGHPSILEVAPDGTKVISVWGRDVVVWDLAGAGTGTGTGTVRTYNLNAVRGNGINEGWPLAVSPDCRYIACRTEEGFDVSDVETGKFRGDFATPGSVITCAAFTRVGNKIAVGNYDGMIHVYEMITV